MSHTPGPWAWDGKFTVTITNADGDSMSFRTLPENARLIAAAPDLLAALKTLLAIDAVRYANDKGPVHKGWQSDELVTAIFQADDAITKAEGAQ